MIDVRLTRLDGQFITKRTGSHTMVGTVPHLPVEGGTIVMIYKNPTDSLGVSIATDDILVEDNIIYFTCIDGFRYSLEVL